jgi:photosystem II stability/assembly factor-like uncharacterized protein
VGEGVILATTDGGRTWKQQLAASRYNLLCVACAGVSRAWAMGDSTERNVVLATTDGGTTWKVQYSKSPRSGETWTGMAFADASHGWLVGPGGLILATTDGGTTWAPQRSGTKMTLLDVAFADASHGLVVGQRTKGDDPFSAQFVDSIVLHTTDGGATWKH